MLRIGYCDPTENPEKILEQVFKRQPIVVRRAEKMKIRILVALIGIAGSLPVTAYAQQKDAENYQLRQRLEMLGHNYDEAFENGDATALAATFVEDAVLVTDTGPVYGRDAIEKYYSDLFKQVHFSNQTANLDQYSPHMIGAGGNEEWINGQWSTTIQVNGGGPIKLKGYWSSIVFREGDIWKRQMQFLNVTP
jgi:ketosteroid isomerase-like protein